ncbi:MAG: flagellar hook-associated protein FlgL [Endozoicomonas sp.]
MSSTTASMNKSLMQLSTGKRILSPSDDVLASNQILGLNDQLAMLETYEKNIGSAQNSLSMAETVVTDMVNVLNRVRDLVLASGSATVQPYPTDGEEPVQPLPPEDGEGDRTAHLQEIEMLMETLMDLANTKSSSGEYIFGGTQGDRPPVGEGDDGIFVGGSDGSREIQISDSQTVILGIVAGDLFSLDDGENIFSAMEEFLAIASDPNTTQDEFDQIMADTLDAIDETLGNMNQSLTKIGASMNTLDMAANSNAEMQMYNDMLVSGLEDLDYASAITEYSMLLTQMQAGQKAYAMVGSTSLFDYV